MLIGRLNKFSQLLRICQYKLRDIFIKKNKINELPNIKFSIILPFLNSEKTISDAIDSVLSQSYCNFELLCIDNGSDDNSYNIIKKKRDFNNKIRVLKSKNGVSAARNVGIKNATGDYIIFLDSDDELLDNSLSILAKCINNCKADIFVYSASTTFKSLKIKMHLHSYWSINKTKCFKLLFKHPCFKPYIFNKAFNKDYLILNKILFDESLKIGEDQDFMFKSILNANSIITFDLKLYYYKYNFDSTMNKITRNPLELLNNHLVLISNVIELYKNKNLYLLEKRKLESWAHNLIYNQFFYKLDNKTRYQIENKYKILLNETKH